MKRIPLYQKVTVRIDRWDDGLRQLLKDAAGAPQRGSTVTLDEHGVTVSWQRSRKPSA